MDATLLMIHSILRWVILILILVAIFRSFGAGSKPFTDGHKKNGLFLMIACDIMLLIGIFQWVTGGVHGYGLPAIQSPEGMAGVMKDPLARFYTVEHLLMMIIAIILVHVGYSFSKKNISDAKKHTKTTLFYILALLVMLAAIPWPFREAGMGRGWI